MTNHNEEIGREELHFRRIDMRAWRRADGLYEVEGRVTDHKPHDFTTADGMKRVPANEPIHDMGVRLAVTAQCGCNPVTRQRPASLALGSAPSSSRAQRYSWRSSMASATVRLAICGVARNAGLSVP